MRARSWAFAALTWVAVVVVVAMATWTVIDSAGRLVLTAPAEDSTPGGPASTDPGSAASAPARRTTSRPAASDAHSESPAAPASARGQEPSPQESATTSGPLPPQSIPRASADSRSTSPPTNPEVSTWQGVAGSVTARCLRSRISLVSASPADGWRMEVDQRGPEQVRVHFERGETDDESESESEDGEREAEVHAGCRGGVPRFQVEN